MSRKPKYQGTGIFKIPSASDKSKETWRKALVHVVTRDRVVDASFRKQIVEGNVYICERHFNPEDIEIRKYPSFHFYTSITIILCRSFQAVIPVIAEIVDVKVYKACEPF